MCTSLNFQNPFLHLHMKDKGSFEILCAGRPPKGRWRALWSMSSLATPLCLSWASLITSPGRCATLLPSTEKINIQLPELLSKNKPYKTVSARAMEDTKVIKLPFGAFKVKSQLYEWWEFYCFDTFFYLDCFWEISRRLSSGGSDCYDQTSKGKSYHRTAF